jgi:hypothetical protein
MKCRNPEIEKRTVAWIAEMDRKYRGLLSTRSCAICDSPCKRKYCCAECRKVGIREYKAEWQRQPAQQERQARWRAANRERRQAYNREHFQANRTRYLMRMRLRHATKRLLHAHTPATLHRSGGGCHQVAETSDRGLRGA